MSAAAMTNYKQAVGFDIGIQNLAVCVVESRAPEGVTPTKDDIRIVYWNVLQLLPEGAPKKDKTVTQACKALPPLFESVPILRDARHVIIELQANINPTMRIVSHALQTYYVTKEALDGIPRLVRFSAAVNKLKMLPADQKDEYRKRKTAAVDISREWLEHFQWNSPPDYYSNPSEHVNFFESLSKKDDAADSFLHALYWLTTTNVVETIKIQKSAEKALAKAEKESKTTTKKRKSAPLVS